MAVKVIGKRIGTFTDRKTNEVISFAKLFITYPAPEDMKGAEGEVAEAISVKPELAAQISINSEVELYYNKYGKVHAFDFA